MERLTLLSALSPQLQAMVEASLGDKLPATTASATTSRTTPTERPGNGDCDQKPAELIVPEPSQTAPTNKPLLLQPYTAVKLNPAELFALKHPASPGFVIKEEFLGRECALAARDALVEYAKHASFHDAKVGAGESLREEHAVRGDRIHWITRPRDLNDETSALSPAIRHLLKRVEALVFDVKKKSPELNLRNITSTQFAIFPGDGARFVKHTDTYATVHPDAAVASGRLSRLITCVYYLNSDWEPDHGGQLRVYVPGNDLVPKSQWDVPPSLDTLLVFRSHDVEHEVLSTIRERMAITIWYYGTRGPVSDDSTPASLSSTSIPSAPLELPVSHDDNDDSPCTNTIFVAIPSYRDPECLHTVDDLFARAKFPDRVSVGICLQSTEDDETLKYLQKKYSSDKVRIDWVDYRHAAGPCPARARAQTLWRGEKFHLQIDSHMRFRPGWDVFLIQELAKCSGASKPILTTYPLGYSLPNRVSSDTRPTVLCARTFNDDGILRQSSRILKQKADRPIPSLFWAAGFAFSSAEVIRAVPYDKRLQFLFFGEETSMSVRLWTSGWDFFAPTEAVTYHLWKRDYRPTFQEVEDTAALQHRQESLAIVKRQLMESLTSDETGTHWPLGSERSVIEYAEHIGVDFASQTVEWRSEWGNLDPQRFDLSAVITG